MRAATTSAGNKAMFYNSDTTFGLLQNHDPSCATKSEGFLSRKRSKEESPRRTGLHIEGERPRQVLSAALTWDNIWLASKQALAVALQCPVLIAWHTCANTYTRTGPS